MRSTKERATIPQLLDDDWLNMRVPPPPPPPAEPVLQDDETIINPHFMEQLLRYGISLGRDNQHVDQDQLACEGEVRFGTFHVSNSLR